VITTHCQRWRDRRGTYRVQGEPIQTRLYEVAPIETDNEARPFVKRHHYSGTYVAARFRVGLYRAQNLVGIAVFSVPCSQAAGQAALPFAHEKGVELGRFVLLDDVPANGESWFLARAFELARQQGFDAVASHADPEPRATGNGGCIFPGHVGTVYQSLNASYLGRTPTRTWRMFSDGSVFNARAWSKLRSRDKGWQYVVDQLVTHGAPEPRGPWDEWVNHAVRHTTRTFRHRGTHRYVWALESALRAHLPRSLAYPKFDYGRTLALSFDDAPPGPVGRSPAVDVGRAANCNPRPSGDAAELAKAPASATPKIASHSDARSVGSVKAAVAPRDLRAVAKGPCLGPEGA
jgi:hypothetical protein